MKTTSTLLLMTSLAFTLNAQTLPHQSAPPPVNPGYSFTRSLSVDCTKQILSDMAFGSQGEEADLLDFIRNNFFGYVILRDLENAGVFGDPVYESTLHRLIFDIHAIDPNILVGICGSYSPTFQNNFVYKPNFPSINCDGEKFQFIPEPPLFGNPKSISGFFMNVYDFEKNFDRNNLPDECLYNFDAIYLDYPYWNTTTSMSDMQHEFQKFKDILKLMRLIKCHSSCIRFIDAEFLPSDIFRLQGWTAIDQITEADTLIDRIVIPAYTDDPNMVFNLRCKLMHWLSDQFSKTGSNIFVKLNAESSSFTYCNSPSTPNNYLGDYLNGITTPSGNMYSVERLFINYFNDPNYVCPACNCSTYVDNHFTTNNMTGNNLAGTIWTPYFMMKDHQLFRTKNNSNTTVPIGKVIVFDVLGKCLGAFENENAFREKYQNNSGIYFLKDISGNVFKFTSK